MARQLLFYQGMRSILALFVMTAVGFGFILQKKDASESTNAKTKSAELNQASRNNWMKHAIDKSRTVAQNVSTEPKGSELP